MQISYYDKVFDVKSTKTILFEEFLSGVKNGRWQDAVLKYRVSKSKKDKENCACITPCGYFSENRSAAKLTEHSGFINIDIDAKDNPGVNLLEMRAEFGTDNNIHSFHISIGGEGLSIYVKIKKTKHIESYFALEKYFSSKYNLIIDDKCKDVSRLRFVSYDPEVFINEKAKTWTEYLPKKDLQPSNYTPIFVESDIDHIFNQINQRRIDLTNDYADWLKIGFSLISEFGTGARSKFHEVSRNSEKYNQEKCDKKFDNLLKSGSQKFKINTFFWLCKQAGIEIKTPQTRKIENIVNLRKKEIGKNGGSLNVEAAKESAIEYLTQIEKIPQHEILPVLEKVMNAESSNITEKEQNGIEQITDYIKSLPIKFNTVTKKVEYKGDELTDKIQNSIYLNTLEILPKSKVSKDLILSLLNSDRIREYNPFLDFFDKYSYMKPKGRILELLSCLRVKNDTYARHCGNFIEKWLISLIASIHGTYSLLILVLVGEQMTGKTKFFRGLLPAELSNYFAESKLDKDKDDEILMSNKLIILDDEFAGKSKVESKKLKELSSKQKMTLRKSYGHHSEDYQRIAVLCGTSNDIDIINDPTGNRRILPVQIMDIDYSIYDKIDKIELFMELFWKWKEVGDNWMLTKEEVATLNEHTTQFLEVSMEEDLILKYFTPSDPANYTAEFMTATEMMTYCEQFLTKQHLYHKKFGQILKKIGYEKIKKGNCYGFYCLKNQI